MELDQSTKYFIAPVIVEDRDTFTVTIIADANDNIFVTSIMKYPRNIFNKLIIDELIDLQRNYSGKDELEDFETEHLNMPSGDRGSCSTLHAIYVTYTDQNGIPKGVALNIKP